MLKTTVSLDAYRSVAPQGAIDLLHRLAERVRGRSLVHVNSTRVGGGVAEMLHRYLPLFEELGVPSRWEVIRGGEEFFRVTKSLHNALQGAEQAFSDAMFQTYLDTNRDNARALNLDADMVIIHDPQPAALIATAPKRGPWVWRCHIDVSHPQRRAWAFLRQFVVRYDAAIFSLPKFAQRLPIPQYLIYPSIDPLSEKNRPLEPEEVDAVLARLGIPRDKPILLQVSRFDRFKDPLGVINAYRIVKKYDDCRLILAGGGATDDPEGEQVLAEVSEAAAGDPDIHILVLPPTAHHEINALQRAADIIIQKSTREGFGLTVAEGMWKGKPVIGGFAGGITVQIIYGVTGYTVNSVEGCAFRIRHLLNNPGLAKQMGENAREYVRENFLITRDLAEHLALMVVHLEGLGP
ncbi:MAG: glycosyltransferase [Armatimonadota bacterium]|nr:glycosyltransferase [Armatimonadota bacterium]MDR7451103.1 glycosyltransferase [Armatimonadota bacterium]MDR7467292.1 glycosyltransferase [Armatimonadota bacterium]MDR7494553.1 glycosyltransferase [Armatimonadota bacterium]MDR7499870.1 glycosyltransferase [Armatimonadota bacterium]